MSASLRLFGFDPETGQLDIDRAEGHVTAPQRSRFRLMNEIIAELSQVFGKEIPISEVRNRATQQGMDFVSIDNLLDQMKNQGWLAEPRPGFLQKV
jgi:DNA replicative helicase MCM subunit Mcm2 (Cdc46/Mcm family)